MSTPAIPEVQPVGFDAKLGRLRAVERRLDSLADELEAQEREHTELVNAYNIAVAEHRHLRQSLFDDS